MDRRAFLLGGSALAATAFTPSVALADRKLDSELEEFYLAMTKEAFDSVFVDPETKKSKFEGVNTKDGVAKLIGDNWASYKSALISSGTRLTADIACDDAQKLQEAFANKFNGSGFLDIVQDDFKKHYNNPGYKGKEQDTNKLLFAIKSSGISREDQVELQKIVADATYRVMAKEEGQDLDIYNALNGAVSKNQCGGGSAEPSLKLP